MHRLLRKQHDDLRWREIFILLSLDRVEPFLPYIGLQIRDLHVVREVARRFVEEYSRVPAVPEAQEQLMQRTFAEIAETTNEETARSLYSWGIERVSYGAEERGHRSTWRTLLGRLAGIYRESVRPPDLPPEKVAQIRLVVRDELGDEFWRLHEQIEQADEQPKSTWDAYIYQDYQSGLPEIENPSPITVLIAILRDQHFQSVWRRIKSILTPGEMETLLTWARTEAQNIGINSLQLPP